MSAERGSGGSAAKRLYDATWGRAFARIYDRMFAAAEEAGLREQRRSLLAGARGRTLEIGAGTGANLPLYGPGVSELVLTEPFEPMARRLREHAAEAVAEADVVAADADRLPFADQSFDTVVSTLVLCTVPEQAAALAEVTRVLRPDGRLLFLEHVRSPDSERLGRWQDRLRIPWQLFGHGCVCNRDTLASIEASGLRTERLERAEFPKSPPIVRPLIVGAASHPS